MKAAFQNSVENLESVMRQALVADGWSPCAVEGYVAAQKRHGWLRPSTPPAQLDAAELFYALPPASGFGDQSPPRITP